MHYFLLWLSYFFFCTKLICLLHALFSFWNSCCFIFISETSECVDFQSRSFVSTSSSLINWCLCFRRLRSFLCCQFHSVRNEAKLLFDGNQKKCCFAVSVILMRWAHCSLSNCMTKTYQTNGSSLSWTDIDAIIVKSLTANWFSAIATQNASLLTQKSNKFFIRQFRILKNEIKMFTIEDGSSSSYLSLHLSPTHICNEINLDAKHRN